MAAVVPVCCGSCTEGSRQLILCLVRRMRPACILVLLSLASCVAGCTEVVRQYRADGTGKLRHVGSFVPEWGPVGKRVSYTLNDATFSYDLSMIRGDVRGHRQPPRRLAAGSDFVPFLVGSDASLIGGAFDAPGATSYGGSIRALSATASSRGDIVRQIRASGISKDYFAKSPHREYRSINGRRWLVTTAYEDGVRRLVGRRVYWAVEGDFLITMYVGFTSAPADLGWREKRLATLEKLVAGFQMRRNV